MTTILGVASAVAPATAAPYGASDTSVAGAPVVERVGPVAGPVGGGTRVVVWGVRLVGVRQVMFGGSPGRAVAVASSSEIHVTAPPHAAGLVHIYVVTGAGRSAVRPANHFTFGYDPHITKISPSSGEPDGNTQVTISGSHLDRLTGLRFGGGKVDAIKHVSASTVVVTAPNHAPGVVSLYLRGRYPGELTSVRYTYLGTPLINPPDAPRVGPTTGSDSFTIYGSRFYDVRKVEFGTMPATVLSTYPSQVTVRVPPHAAGTVDIRVITAYGASAISADDRYFYRPPVTLRAGAVARVDTKAGALTRISCASAAFCVAGDEYGNLYTYDGSSLSVPVHTAAVTAPIEWISCTSTTSCLAAQSGGGLIRYDGTGWSPVAAPMYGIDHVSCVSAFCAGITVDDKVSVWNGSTGSTWSVPASVTSRGHLEAVSCASADYCVVVTDAGAALTWDGHGWSAARRIAAGQEFSAVSCPAVGTCITGSTSSAGVFRVETGEALPSLPGPNTRSLSCTSATFCVAVENSALQMFDGRSWSTVANRLAFEVSCLSTDNCAAISQDAVTQWNGTTWGAATGVELAYGDPDALSCGSASRCVLVELSGIAIDYDGTSWQAPDHIDARQGLVAVSCATDTDFCAAVDEFGNVFTSRAPRQWSGPTALTTSFSGVGCASSTLCVASGPKGAFRWDGTSWSSTAPDATLRDVSCPTAEECLALDVDGHAHSFDGTTWSTLPAAGTHKLTRIACAQTFCLALDDAGYTVGWDGTSWQAAEYTASDGLVRDLSCASSTSCVLVEESGYQTYDGSGWSAPQTMTDGDNGRAGDAGVACPAPTSCVLVWNPLGEYGSAFGVTLTP